jgi:hypothetical protein
MPTIGTMDSAVKGQIAEAIRQVETMAEKSESESSKTLSQVRTEMVPLLLPFFLFVAVDLWSVL